MAKKTKQLQIEELQAKLNEYMAYCKTLEDENKDLRERMDNEQLNEHSGIIGSLNLTIQQQDEMIAQLKASKKRADEKLQEKNERIRELKLENINLQEQLKLLQEIQIHEEAEPVLPDIPKHGQMGRPKLQLTEQQQQEINLMLQNGFSQRTIAKKYNCSVGFINKFAKQHR